MKDNKVNNLTIEDITIPIMMYESLIITRQNYINLINYLFDIARLSYDKQYLRFKEDLEILKYLEPLRYEDIMNKLIKEEEKCLKQ